MRNLGSPTHLNPPLSLSVSGMDVFGRSAAPLRFCDDSEKFENYAWNAANDKRVFFTRQDENVIVVLFFSQQVFLADWKLSSWQHALLYYWTSRTIPEDDSNQES